MAGKKRRKTLRTVHVNAGAGYDILIEPGILSYAGEHAVRVCPKASKAAVVCDRNVFFPHAEPVEGDLWDAGLSCVQLLLEPGEEHKNIETYSEILAFLAENNIEYRIDETNAQDHYTRNRIRGSILPLAKELVNEQAPSHIAAAANKLSVIREYLDEEAEKAFGKCAVFTENGDLLIRTAPFLALHPALRPHLLIHCLDRLCSMKDIGEEHIEALLALFSRQSGKQLSLPRGVTVLREAEHIRLTRKAPKGSEDPEPPVSLRVVSNPFSSPLEVPKSDCKKYLDYDTMKNTPVLRHRLPGDYLYVDGASGVLHKKSLNRLLIDKKIPVSERDSLLLLADGSHVLWVLGYRISAAAKVSEETERILEVTWTRSKS